MLNSSRIAQAQERMRELGIDAYLILTHDDYIYFFGEDRFQPRAVVPAQGIPSLSPSWGRKPRSGNPWELRT